MLKKILFLLLIPCFALMAVSVWAAPTVLDVVDIGSPLSEASHNLTGWGPIEPATHGGGWGGFGVSGENTRVTYAGDENDHPIDRSASVIMHPQYKKKVNNIEMRVLDGIGNDDFQVFIEDHWGNKVLVYQYVSDELATENWKIHNIDVSDLKLDRESPEIVIQSTGSKWSLHSTYGQLAVDWIKVSK